MALRVIGAGFGRTGTTSLKAALERLGFETCHHMEEVAKYAPIFWKYQDEYPEEFQDIFSRTQFSANINESVIAEVAVQLEGCVISQ